MPEKIKSLTEWQKCIPLETSGILEICKKLTKLEKAWTTLFNGKAEAIGRETAPSGCGFEDNSLILTVSVKNTTLLTSLRFKETAIRKQVEHFVGIKVKKIEFISGRVQRPSTAKAANRAFERYTPLTLTEEQVAKQKELLVDFGAGEEITEAVARVKALVEKKTKSK